MKQQFFLLNTLQGYAGNPSMPIACNAAQSSNYIIGYDYPYKPVKKRKKLIFRK